MSEFRAVWQEVRGIPVGTVIPNWSYDSGYTQKNTTVESSNYDEITVSGERTTGRRAVRRTDFEKVYEVWDRYKRGDLSRDEIQQLSRNTTYIFSILHWLESQETKDL